MISFEDRKLFVRYLKERALYSDYQFEVYNEYKKRKQIYNLFRMFVKTHLKITDAIAYSFCWTNSRKGFCFWEDEEYKFNEFYKNKNGKN